MELSELETKVVNYLNSNSPATISVLLDALTGEEEKAVRESVVACVSKGAITKFGQRRGTRYAHVGFDTTAPIVVAKRGGDPGQSSSIIEALTSLGPLKSFKDIAAVVGEDVNDLRPAMQSLIKSGAVVQTGDKRGAKYSIAGMVPADAGASTKKASTKAPVHEEGSDNVDFETVSDFLTFAVERLPDGSSGDVLTITKALIESAGNATINGDRAKEYEVSREIASFVKAGKLKASNDDRSDGNRYTYSK